MLTDSFSQILINHAKAGFKLTLIYQLSNLRSTLKLRLFEILLLYNGVILIMLLETSIALTVIDVP